MNKIIYMVVWRGRDSDTGAWLPDWPCWQCGVFSTRQAAEQVCKHYQEIDPAYYDDVAGEYSGYWVKEIPVDQLLVTE